jgi:hypothetical protein
LDVGTQQGIRLERNREWEAEGEKKVLGLVGAQKEQSRSPDITVCQGQHGTVENPF